MNSSNVSIKIKLEIAYIEEAENWCRPCASVFCASYVRKTDPLLFLSTFLGSALLFHNLSSDIVVLLSSVWTHNAGVVSSNPTRFPLQTPSDKKVTGSINNHFPRETQKFGICSA